MNNFTLNLNGDELDLLQKVLDNELDELEDLVGTGNNYRNVAKLLGKIRGARSAHEWK